MDNEYLEQEIADLKRENDNLEREGEARMQEIKRLRGIIGTLEKENLKLNNSLNEIVIKMREEFTGEKVPSDIKRDMKKIDETNLKEMEQNVAFGD